MSLPGSAVAPCWGSTRRRRAQREEDFRNNVLSGRQEVDQAEQSAAAIGKRYAAEADNQNQVAQMRQEFQSKWAGAAHRPCGGSQ